MNKILRIAYFPDSLNEVNGVAMTSNRLIEFARKRKYPLLCVFADSRTSVSHDGSVTLVALKRSPLSIPMDEGLRFDPLFQRHERLVRRELTRFKPDVIHTTGLNDVSIMGAFLAWRMNVASLGSWHTNLHEYTTARLQRRFGFVPSKLRTGLSRFIGNRVLDGAKLYYRMPHVLLAPNQELVDMLEKGTGRLTRLMIRGVDAEMYSPSNRTVTDAKFRIGFVGRLRVEKNVRMLAEIERLLIDAGCTNFEFLIIGEGNERPFLEKNMRFAKFPGFLEGKQLAEGYANMDVFVYPSETDTFGNVPQEAMASGVPAIVSDRGGPKYFVINGENGFVAANTEEFALRVRKLMDDRSLLESMKAASRKFALTRSWDSVFESVYEAYAEAKLYKENDRKAPASSSDVRLTN